jgi:hypothetical protein
MSKFINIIFLGQMIEALIPSLGHSLGVLVAYLRWVFSDFCLPNPLPTLVFFKT